ncbi:MAG: sel1 repeat family protein [Ignavibacteriales bacterium]|nr:sel1 repeat family protein [Ignavibacteriales bacterium]
MKTRRTFTVVVLIALLLSAASSQERRRIQTQYGSPFVREIDLNAELLETFVVMQKANAGDISAMHELGLRYLEGRTVPADTIKGALWIAKAAGLGLPVAQFNLGILYTHGWGVAWNPFEAFKTFRAAAEQDMDIAQFLFGLQYTEGLVVPRSYRTAYTWIKRAADKGYDAAKGVAAEFVEKDLLNKDSTFAEPAANDKKKKHAKADSTLSPVFLSFHTDTSRNVSDSVLIAEAVKELSPKNPAALRQPKANVPLDSAWRNELLRAASSGNPEALVVIGRFFERGTAVRQDPVLAATYYFRALRLDSPRAPGLLWELMQTNKFQQEFDLRTKANDPDALYVWAGITAVGFSKLLDEKQALQQLQRAVAVGHVPAMIELGLCYLGGRWVQRDPLKGGVLWQQAMNLGSPEARIRLATAVVLGELSASDPQEALKVLKSAAQEGSLIAQSAIGLCYEQGIGVARDKGEAATWYRKAATRGSQIAYRSLRRMHDEIRPADKEFQLEE